jgi:hypothetical protein
MICEVLPVLFYSLYVNVIDHCHHPQQNINGNTTFASISSNAERIDASTVKFQSRD